MPLLPDWSDRLMAYLDACAEEPFVWGADRQDCALFAAAGVAAQTDEHPCPDVPGSYHDAEGAQRLLDERGGLEAFATGILGPPLPTWRMVRRGGVVLFTGKAQPGEPEERLSLCVGDQLACKGFGGGVGIVRLGRAKVAWNIG